MTDKEKEKTVKVSQSAITPFSGKGGMIEAVKFMRQVESLQTTNKLKDEDVAAMVANLFKEGSPAQLWYDTLVLRQDKAVTGWEDGVKRLMGQKYVRPMKMAEFAKMKSTLSQQSSEKVDVFHDRVQMAWLVRDFSLDPSTKKMQGYQATFQRDVKESFIHGLSQRIRGKMTSSNFEDDDLGMLLTAAMRAEENQEFDSNNSSLGGAAAGAAEDWTLTEEEQAHIAAFRYQRGGGAGRGAGRGGGQGGQGGKPQKKKVVCTTCGLYGYHGNNPTSCPVDLEDLRQKGRGKFAKEGGGRGGGPGYGGRGGYQGRGGQGGRVDASGGEGGGDDQLYEVGASGFEFNYGMNSDLN